MKKPKVKAVVLRTKRLKGSGFVGCWAHNGGTVTEEDAAMLLKYAIQNCGKPPYDITVEIR